MNDLICCWRLKYMRMLERSEIHGAMLLQDKAVLNYDRDTTGLG